MWDHLLQTWLSVYMVNLRLGVSKEVSLVFALCTISTVTGRVQWVLVFVEHFSPLSISPSMSHSLWHAQLWRHLCMAAC